jgi:hypothetical protein
MHVCAHMGAEVTPAIYLELLQVGRSVQIVVEV